MPNRSRERRLVIEETAALYDVSVDTLTAPCGRVCDREPYGVQTAGLHASCRKPRWSVICELIAAIKHRTSNRQGHHLSTTQALRLLEDYGVSVENGHIQAPKGVLKKTTVNRYLKQWGLNRGTLGCSAPAVHFQARYSNQCWQFDLSPSDMK